MIFNLPCMSTNKTAKHCIVKTLSKTQLNETSHCKWRKKRRKQSFISKYKKKQKRNEHSQK